MREGVAAFALVGAVALGAGLLAAGRPGELLERALGQPLLVRLRGAVEPPGGAVLVALDRDSADALGLPRDLAGWPRELLARAVERMHAAGALAVALDLRLERPARGSEAAGVDARLARAIAAAGNVVLFSYLDDDARRPAAGTGPDIVRVAPLPLLPDFAVAARAVAPFPLPRDWADAFWAFPPAAAGTPSLPASALLTAATRDERIWRELAVGDAALAGILDEGRAEGLVPLAGRLRQLLAEDRARLAALTGRLDVIATAGGAGRVDAGTIDLARAALRLLAGPNSRPIAPYARPGGLPRISYHRILAGDPEALAALRGRVVFVGASDPGSSTRADTFATALPGAGGVQHAGTELAQTAYLSLLHGDGPTRLPAGAEGLLAGLAAAGTAAGALVARLPWALLAAGLAAAAATAAAAHVFATTALALPLASLLVLGLPAGLAAGLSMSHGRLRRHLARAVLLLTRGHVRRAERLPAWEAGTARERRWVVCIASDIASYVGLTERMGGREADLADLIADYRGLVHEVVERHGGYVADFTGDATMSLWEADAPSPGVRVRAVRAALDLAETLDRFAASRGVVGHATRLGLAEGWVVVGNVDGKGRLTFGAIGAPLNVASRLEQLNKEYGTRILATAAVVESLADVRSRAVGPVVLRGRAVGEEVVEIESRQAA